MNNKKNIDDYFDDNFEVTYTGDLPSIPVGRMIMTTGMTTQTTLTIMKLTTTTMKQTGLLLIMTMIMKKRALMSANDQPDGQNVEIPADVPIPLPKNWLLRSGILPAPEVLPLRN